MELNKLIEEFKNKYGVVKLDLACGNNKKNEEYIGIDIAETESSDFQIDLQKYPWPIETSSIDEINISHYLEHIPHLDIKGIVKETNSFEEFKERIINCKDGFIEFFNELNRILKVGGKVHVTSPYYTSIRAYGDPTHTRYLGDWSFFYLNKEWRDGNKLSHYNLECDFDIKYSYFITNEISLKSEEVRNKAFAHDWNVIDDIIVELIKK